MRGFLASDFRHFIFSAKTQHHRNVNVNTCCLAFRVPGIFLKSRLGLSDRNGGRTDEFHEPDFIKVTKSQRSEERPKERSKERSEERNKAIGPTKKGGATTPPPIRVLMLIIALIDHPSISINLNQSHREGRKARLPWLELVVP